jgi:hypothetical protein
VRYGGQNRYNKHTFPYMFVLPALVEGGRVIVYCSLNEWTLFPNTNERGPIATVALVTPVYHYHGSQPASFVVP